MLLRINLIKVKKEAFGYRCLASKRQFYVENYPNLVIEKGSIDEMILVMVDIIMYLIMIKEFVHIVAESTEYIFLPVYVVCTEIVHSCRFKPGRVVEF